jgi:cob(I)alamin adenosyltransferase
LYLQFRCPHNENQFPAVHTKQLEKWIDEIDAALPPLKNFVIPVRFYGSVTVLLIVVLPQSGGLCSTHLNLARAVCRRAERRVHFLIQNEQAGQEVGRYLNRLSDFLFACSRHAAVSGGHTEILWKKAD